MRGCISEGWATIKWGEFAFLECKMYDLPTTLRSRLLLLRALLRLITPPHLPNAFRDIDETFPIMNHNLPFAVHRHRWDSMNMLHCLRYQEAALVN